MNTLMCNQSPYLTTPQTYTYLNPALFTYYIDYNKPIILSADASIQTINRSTVYSAAHVIRYNTSLGMTINKETIYPDPTLIQVSDAKIKIQDLETFAIITGLNSISRLGFFQQIYVISDNEQALKTVTNFLQQMNCQLDIKLFWVKSHQYLVNDIADAEAGCSSTRTFSNAKIEELIPNGAPFSQFSYLGYTGGLGRAYPQYQRDSAFSNLTPK